MQDESQAPKKDEIRQLRPSEIVNVFGRLVDHQTGNWLLRALHEQRVSGTLDQGVEKPRVTPDMIESGLKYLRKHYPVDEDEAIMRRIVQEDEKAEQTALAEIEKARNWKPQESVHKDGVYGKSKVDSMVKRYNESRKKSSQEREKYMKRRAENTEVVFEEELERVGREIQRKISEVHYTTVGNSRIRKVKGTSYAPVDNDPEEQAQELSGQSSEPGLVKTSSGQYNIVQGSRRSEGGEKWWHKYEKRAMLTNWDGVSEPPHLPWSRRWGLPTLFMLLSVGGSFALAEFYTPPLKEARLFPNTPPAAATAMVLIGLNVTVWLMWKIPPLWRFMNKNMLLHAVIPKPIQLLGNTFSHQHFSHLAMNMVLLWVVGTKLHDQIGRGEFLALYIGGGVFASWSSLTHFLVTRQFLQATLGASGALCAVLSCYLWFNTGLGMEWSLWPGEWKPSFKPEHLLILLICMEAFGAFYYLRSGKGKLDHFSHLGGYVAGISSAEWMRRKAATRKRPSRRDRH